MSISEAASHRGSSGDLYCPRCGKPLHPQATFCSSCGERLDKKQALSSLLKDEQDITNRYRITSLVRRRPYVNLYFALDRQQSRQGQQRMVAIRDIDITSLHPQARAQAIEAAQQEYDLLCLWRLPHVLRVVDLQYSRGHLFIVSDYPPIAASQGTTGKPENTKASTGKVQRLYTLQDFLQSGQGLPSEQQALKWMANLCQAVDGLHSHHIILCELDPYTIVLNENSNEAEPALMISWLPPQLKGLLRSSHGSMSFWSYFCAPEALQGKAEPRSDIYSLGAVLYLLFTGSPPIEGDSRARERLRSPRELNGRISAHVNDCVMQALASEPSKRFQHALEMSEALFNPHYSRLHMLKLSRRENEVIQPPVPAEEDAETVRIVPLSQKHADRWRASRPQATTPAQIPHRPLIPRAEPQSQELEEIQAAWQQPPVAPLQSQPVSAAPADDLTREALPVTPPEQYENQEASSSQQTSLQEEPATPPLQTSQSTAISSWKQRVTAIMPALSLEKLKQNLVRQEPLSEQSPIETVETIDQHTQQEAALPWFAQLQRLVLGQQQRAIMAAALIETPVCVQPDQVFTLRFHILGRDEPTIPPETQEGERSTQLSSLIQGDRFSIEVRAVLNQSDTYVVQHTTAVIPAAGYVTEVAIPLQPPSDLPGGRRDRLHVFFFDEHRRHLYDKPFVVEVFVSHFVKRGHEGYHVLAIPA